MEVEQPDVARLVLSSRNDSRGIWGLAALILVTCASFYLLFWSGHQYSIDGVVMFQYAKAILFRHSFVLDPPIPWPQEIRVSYWAMGTSFAYMPILWVLSNTVFAGDISFTQTPYNPNVVYNSELIYNTPYLYSSFLNTAVTSVTAAVLFLFAVELGFSKRQAAAAALVFGICSPAAAYSKYDYAQPLASLLLLCAFLFLTVARRRNIRLCLFLSGLALGLLVITRVEMVALAVPIFMLCLYLLGRQDSAGPGVSTPRWHRWLFFCLPLLLLMLTNQYLNYLRMGSGLSVGYSPNELKFDPYWVGFGIVGNLISPGRGILVFYPLALLSLSGAIRVVRKPIYLAMILLLAWAILFYSFWREWDGGVSWGPRFLIPFLPYITILGFIGAETIRPLSEKQRRGLLIVLIGGGLLFAVQGLLFDFVGFYGSQATAPDLPDDLASHGADHFFLQYSPIFAGWNGLANPRSYDVYWVRHLTDGSGLVALVVFLIALLFGSLSIYWWSFVRSPWTRLNLPPSTRS